MEAVEDAIVRGQREDVRTALAAALGWDGVPEETGEFRERLERSSKRSDKSLRGVLEAVESGMRRSADIEDAASTLGGRWWHVEAVDASHLQGSDAAVAIATLHQGAAAYSTTWPLSECAEYVPGDDCGALAWAVRQRFANVSQVPDVLVVDGGKAQARAVAKAAPAATRVVALAKGDRHSGAVLQREGEKLYDSDGTLLAANASVPRLVRRARDEAHSAAIAAHRRLRQARLVAPGEDRPPVAGVEASRPRRAAARTVLDELELERLTRLSVQAVAASRGEAANLSPPRTTTGSERERARELARTRKADDQARREVHMYRQGFVHRSSDEMTSDAGFELEAPFEATGPQRAAVEAVCARLDDPESGGVAAFRGVTGSGKTLCMASMIAKRGVPALVLAPNKVLAAQLYDELRRVFPKNSVQHFVSYYDMYRPESYAPNADRFLQKRSAVNEKLDELRHLTTASLATRRDVVVVASISCIYGLGVPDRYGAHAVHLGDDFVDVVHDLLIQRLEFRRDDAFFARSRDSGDGDDGDDGDDDSEAGRPLLRRGHLAIRKIGKRDAEDADAVEALVVPADDAQGALRLVFRGPERRLASIRAVADDDTELESASFLPAHHYARPLDDEGRDRVCRDIERELADRLATLLAEGKTLEADRLAERTTRDVASIRATGRCGGVENYSRHFAGSAAGDPPVTLLDYFPAPLDAGRPRFLVVVDESHLTLPQLGSCSAADRARKASLIGHGFRLPSAADNRPLTSSEFWDRVDEAILVSATPGKHEDAVLAERSAPGLRDLAAELVVRPTLICDPVVRVRPATNEVADALVETKMRAARGERTLVVAISVDGALAVANEFAEAGVRTAALVGSVKPVERASIIRRLQTGALDCVVGCQLLREGLDLPECSLVVVLAADKEGFLRTDTSLIQTIGRAARHVRGQAILYADRVTDAMRRAIDETDRRRSLQLAYNAQHNLIARPILARPVADVSLFDVLTADSEHSIADLLSGTPTTAAAAASS